MKNKSYCSLLSFSAVLMLTFLSSCSAQKKNDVLANPWKVKQQIEKSVVVPVFKNQAYNSTGKWS